MESRVWLLGSRRACAVLMRLAVPQVWYIYPECITAVMEAHTPPLRPRTAPTSARGYCRLVSSPPPGAMTLTCLTWEDVQLTAFQLPGQAGQGNSPGNATAGISGGCLPGTGISPFLPCIHGRRTLGRLPPASPPP